MLPNTGPSRFVLRTPVGLGRPIGRPGCDQSHHGSRSSSTYWEQLLWANPIRKKGERTSSPRCRGRPEILFNTFSGSATAYSFGADNSDSVTESTGTIGHVSMIPKTIGALSKFSRLMDLQSIPDIEQLIRADFVALLADAIDAAAINRSAS